MSSLLEQIQDSLRRYIDREIELHELENVLLPLIWDMDSSQSSEAVKLGGRAHNVIAEFAKGDRSEASLREELAKTVRPFVLVIHVGSKAERTLPVQSGTASVDVEEPKPLQKATSAFRPLGYPVLVASA